MLTTLGKWTRSHKIIITSSTNPHLNLAKELSLLYMPKSDENILYLWRNAPTVVIGKHQNPYKECNLEFMKKEHITLARRPTGGGAVYQDLGNTCWTFLSPKFTPQHNTGVIVSALKQLGIDSYGTGRNDVEVDGKKISGAAFRKAEHRSIHHGTMLFNVNMANLSKVLTVDQSKLQAKGVDSVRSRVMNLVEIKPDINHEMFCDAMIKEYQKILGNCEIIHSSAEDFLQNEDVKKRYELLSSHKWLFGQCSSAKVSFSKRFDFGLFDVTVIINNGEIQDIKVNSDCLVNEITEDFQIKLLKCIKSKSVEPLSEYGQLNKEMVETLFKWAQKELGKYF